MKTRTQKTETGNMEKHQERPVPADVCVIVITF